MSSDKIERKRSVNVENLSDEQLQVLIQQISDKVISMVDETCERANKLLDVYGLETKMQIVIQAKGTGKSLGE